MVQFLGVVSHPNLAKLLGYCSIDGERGSNGYWVLNPLPWITRLPIMLGAAQARIGLSTRGTGSPVTYIVDTVTSVTVHYLDVIYRDFKSSNVLLDEDLSRSHFPSIVTYGVLVWCYMRSSLEACLRKTRPTAEQKLLYWVRQYPADSKKFSMIIDLLLRDQYSINAARKIAKLADSCLNKNAKDRPTMNRVVEILKQLYKIHKRVPTL
ncbi:putative transferase [Rosa chinensis]|uniref:Putative transferase n=1 Tax=Rosa chinensis TaxID=74649 RepID=A0A2P6P9D2_ROSCH|nr:putative transferase [Rosa chinensis]